jgi:hypothetical protein
MINTLLKSKCVVRTAVLMAFATIAFASAESVYAQKAGFASSREESAGMAESGARRLRSLNPFRSSAPELGGQAPLVQPIATARSSSSGTSRSSQLAAESETRTASRSRNAASVNPRVESLKRSTRSSTNGVASALIDELEEDFEAVPPARELSEASSESDASRGRRSLRRGRGLESLELLDDGSSEIEELEETEEGEESEEADDFSDAIPQSEKSANVLNTEVVEDSNLIVAEEYVGEESFEVSEAFEVSELDDSMLQSKNARAETQRLGATKTLESIDSRFEAYREGGEAQSTIENVSKSVAETVASSASLAPIVTIETIGPKRLIVGQESTYKVVVRNEGGKAARKLVVTTKLPETVVASTLDVQVGSAFIEEVGDRSNAKRCVWQVGTLDSKQEYALSLNITPMRRAAFELVSNFEFERASARTDVQVHEPILEALIEGRDSIEWGVEDKFRVRLRNVGNGDAENVELYVSTGENQATQRLGLLRAGEEKTIETSIKTVAEDYFTIDVQAVGAYGVKTSASRKIGILRGKLNVAVEAPELQFVDGEFDAKIHVRNLGDATLQHVDVVAQIPEGVEPIYCSNQARQNEEKRRVYWSAPFLRPNEETVFTVTCRVNKAGTARFEVVGVDQTGVVAQAESTTTIESIAVLSMRVKAPKEPVAVGRRCVYELIVENNGTKDAQDVNSGVFLGAGLKPVMIEGDQGVVFEKESKVLFNKIERLKAGEAVVFRIQAEAMLPGNQKVQAMLQSAAEDVSLLSEETTYCYTSPTREIPADSGTDVFERSTITADKRLEGTIRK